MLHRQLRRQLKQSGIGEQPEPPGAESWTEFLKRVNRSYAEADQKRDEFERSLAISAAEMHELYQSLQQHSETRLAAERDRLRAVISSLGAGLCILDSELTVVTVNPEAERLLDCSEELLRGRSVLDLISFSSDQGVAPSYQVISMRMALALGQPCRNADGVFVKPSGVTVPVSYTLNPIVEDGTAAGAVLVFLDISARRSVEKALRDSEARLRSLVQHVSDVITITDCEGTISYQSPSIAQVLGYDAEELLGTDFKQLVHTSDRDRLDALLREKAQEPEQASGSLARPIELRLRHRDGGWRQTETVATNLLDDPGVRGIVLTARDVTQRKAFETELVRQAFHDPLTQLPNRARFIELLAAAIAQEGGRMNVAVLFLDLDGFKVVNDSLGHALGDELLSAVAARLAGSLRQGDEIARFGGDEFAVFARNMMHAEDAMRVADRLLADLRQPFSLRGREVFITASIGAALGGRQSSISPQELLREADIAMYQAKFGGKSRTVVFDESMNATAMLRLELETDLRRVVERNELRLMYQPIVNLDDGRVVGAEALVRWQHPRHGLISPADFIPLAEETGLIQPVGEWVLREACRQAQLWMPLQRGAVPLVMSVNLSARQFVQLDLVEKVAAVLRETALDPAQLQLEITESAVMQDADSATSAIGALKQLGVRLAVDDFGTGYSSLGYLRRFDVDTLKVDRTFIKDLETDPRTGPILRAVTMLASSLGIGVTAEGIETDAQLARVRALHCDQGQGFLFARPLPVDEMAGMLDGVRLPATPALVRRSA